MATLGAGGAMLSTIYPFLPGTHYQWIARLLAIVVLATGGWVALADLDPDPDNHYHEDGFGGHHGIDRAALQATLRTLGFVGLTERTVAQRTKAKDGVDYVHDVFLVTGHLPQSQGC